VPVSTASDDLDLLWKAAHHELAADIASASTRSWLDELVPTDITHETVVLAAPHPFAREQLDLRYGPALRGALSRAAGRPLTVMLTVSPDAVAGGSGGPPPAPPPGPAAPAPGSDSALNPKYLFDRFVIGDSNRFAHAAARAAAESPARAYNPLFIYGESGLGKTHLLQAVGHEALHLYPGMRVRYVTSEQFTNDFIDAIRHRPHGAFQRRYREVDVLLIDDIQFLAERERTQEEFFHTFNTLHNAQKQIVISSDRPPKQIGVEDRLRTRFEWGLITDVKPPDLETRIAILRKRAIRDGNVVPDEVLALIADRIASNIRELEGAFIRVVAFASLQNAPVSLNLATMVLKDLFPDGGANEITVSLVMAETAGYSGFTLDELCSTSRTRNLVAARQVAMYLTRELTPLSLPKIGEAFGGRDHTTVMHATRKIGALMSEREGTWRTVQELTARIKDAARNGR
jgi:chromosomal replication initiator protein